MLLIRCPMPDATWMVGFFCTQRRQWGELKAWDSATNSNVPLDKTGEDGLAPKQYRLPTNFAFGATETH
ncbi:conserved hypothetical protein [Agrobacterium genomosp. 2 str. CFBP 5494]|uniref:Uncharacterized protein n=1 Tax=Agrobacterium genomosp. 2 str. CFBP 5494 TaxID=1183436 RepID=A0A9W5F3S4_9HYPH|nr:conserved hypothetical protein [Agrobacterium genomosp. 2 str. CFBP 5494]